MIKSHDILLHGAGFQIKFSGQIAAVFDWLIQVVGVPDEGKYFGKTIRKQSNDLAAENWILKKRKDAEN